MKFSIHCTGRAEPFCLLYIYAYNAYIRMLPATAGT